jgi:uncharacterized membrane protein
MDDAPVTADRKIRSDLFRFTASFLAALLIAGVLTVVWFQFLEPPVAEKSLPGSTAPVIAFVLLFWPTYVAIYLRWTHRAYSSLDRGSLQAVAEADTRKNQGWLGFWAGIRDQTSTAAIVAVLVTVFIALTPGVRENTAVIILTMTMVAASWAMMVYDFAVSYMRMTVAQTPEESPHIRFSYTEAPTFTDFVTFSVMASTLGVSLPGEVTSRTMWRRVRTNGVLAFFFNSVIIAMMVSLVFGGITDG